MGGDPDRRTDGRTDITIPKYVLFEDGRIKKMYGLLQFKTNKKYIYMQKVSTRIYNVMSNTRTMAKRHNHYITERVEG